MGVEEHTMQLDGQPVRFLTAPGAPVLYLHGAPTGSGDWTALLGRTGGTAPDLPGFGRSGKGGHLDYSLAGYIRFLERFLDSAAPTAGEPCDVVAHAWGAAVALGFAGRHPHRVRRLLLFNPVSPLDGFAWPRLVRVLRRPIIGELLLGATNRALLSRTLRRASGSDSAWSEERMDEVWTDFDQGTQRALLRLHRADRPVHTPEALARITAPTLILHGESDPWLRPEDSRALAEALPAARAEIVAGAGHWPWLDRWELSDRVAEHLRSDEPR